MFESLSERLGRATAALRGKGRLTDANITDTLRQVRMAFLEADDNARGQVLESAKKLATVVTVLDLATDEDARTPGIIDAVDKELRRLGGEANALGALWKDNPERIS